MRVHRSLLGLAILAGLAIGRPGAAQQASDRAVADEIIRITRAMWAAEMQKDAAGATRYVADDYTEFNPDFATRLEGKEQSMRFLEAYFKDAVKPIVSDLSNAKVQVFGNVAVLSYNYIGVSQNKEGVNQTNRAKSTRVYVKRGNDWMLVHANFAADPLPSR